MAGLVQVWKLSEPEPVWSEKIDELQVSRLIQVNVPKNNL